MEGLVYLHEMLIQLDLGPHLAICFLFVPLHIVVFFSLRSFPALLLKADFSIFVISVFVSFAVFCSFVKFRGEQWSRQNMVFGAKYSHLSSVQLVCGLLPQTYFLFFCDLSCPQSSLFIMYFHTQVMGFIKRFVILT